MTNDNYPSYGFYVFLFILFSNGIVLQVWLASTLLTEIVNLWLFRVKINKLKKINDLTLIINNTFLIN